MVRRADRIRLQTTKSVIGLLKPEFIHASQADLRYLERSGILVCLRRAAGGDEPRTAELAALLDKKSRRLVVASEFHSSRVELASRIAAGVFDALGLCSRTIRAERVRVVVTSFDPMLLNLWSRNELSTTDHPYGKHPVVSALFMGRPLGSIVRYYARFGHPLPKMLLSREIALYASLVNHWKKSVKSASRTSKDLF